MSNYYYGSALDTELDYRRAALHQQATNHRLLRLAKSGARTGRRGASRDGRRH